MDPARKNIRKAREFGKKERIVLVVNVAYM